MDVLFNFETKTKKQKVTMSVLFSIATLVGSVMAEDRLLFKSSALSFFLRILFRGFELTNRILICVLLWLAVGGVPLACIIAFEIVLLFICAWITNQFCVYAL